MKIYDFGNGNYFEVMDSWNLESTAGVRIKTEKFISKDKALFWFKDERFFDVSYPAWENKKEVTSEEFAKIITQNVEIAWREVAQKQKGSISGVVMLSDYAVSTQKAYMKHHGKSYSEFRESIEQLRQEVLNG